MTHIPVTFFTSLLDGLDNQHSSMTHTPSHMRDRRSMTTNHDQQRMHGMDIFDPYNRRDQLISEPHMNWLDRPESMRQRPELVQPDVPHRYRITLDCAGFNHETLKTELKTTKQGQHVLLVHGFDEHGEQGSDNFVRKELKKSFTLPENVVLDKMVSFMIPGGKLVIEFPLMKKHQDTATGGNRISSILPLTTNTVSGGKEVRVKLPVPENIDLNKIHVSIKDRDLIMRVEDQKVTNDSAVLIHLFDRVTLPENTDWDNIRCVREKDYLLVTSPLTWEAHKPKPHELKVQQAGSTSLASNTMQQQIDENLISSNMATGTTTTGSSKKKNKNKKPMNFGSSI